MSQEIEFKLEVERDASERLIKQSWLGCKERRPERQQSVYFDTTEGDLRRRGYTLRVRSAGGRFVQTVKSLGAAAGMFGRGEWECTVAGPGPDLTKLGETPLADLALGQLKPVIQSDVSRTAVRLHELTADLEVDFDEGLMTASGRSLPVSEIEVELLRGQPESAVALARRIAASIPVKLGVLSKAERGFALADGSLSNYAKAEPVEVRPEMTVAEAFEVIVMACIRHFRLNEPLVIERRSAEPLHQARVGIRRLRAAFSLFRPAIADDEFERIASELRWFMGELGDARNLDVFLQRDHPRDERRFLAKRREEAYDAVIAAMDSQRLRHAMIDLVAWASLGEWRSGKRASQPLTPFANRRIDRLWSKVQNVDKLRKLDEQRRHRLRINVKKLRYALEFTRALHPERPKRRKKFMHSVEHLQEALGHINDAVVAHKLSPPDPWMIAGRTNPEERRYLHDADQALRRLGKAGRYWKSAKRRADA